MSSLGLSQWFSGLLPGTERESSRTTAGPPKIVPAEAEAAKSAEAMLRSFILLCVWRGVCYRWMCNLEWRLFAVVVLSPEREAGPPQSSCHEHRALSERQRD